MKPLGGSRRYLSRTETCSTCFRCGDRGSLIGGIVWSWETYQGVMVQGADVPERWKLVFPAPSWIQTESFLACRRRRITR